ncbi:MAG: HAMP domain-containing histidine kinase, partial [Myxococcales bacterium]|nr:HAMP domain-containing histidine kinase [Myxococcales bacterium]
ELRTPLNAVLGYTELLEDQLERGDTTSALADLDSIRRSANRLLRTLASILELARIEAGGAALQRDAITLERLLERIATSVIESLAEHNNRFEYEAVGGAALDDVLETDLEKLEYCLVSLLDNACRFNRGGLVRLVVDRCERRGAPWLRLEVHDTGIGIAPEDAPRLFESFTQLDDSSTRAYEGSGVSLSVTRAFCRMLGGDVSFTSEPGEGSIFVIELPARAPERDATSP